MKWIGISGTWKITNEDIEGDVRQVVRDLLEVNNGIVVGAALGVDHFAIKEVVAQNKIENVMICLPTDFNSYVENKAQEVFEEKGEEDESVEELIENLKYIYEKRPESFVFSDNTVLSESAYYDLNNTIAEMCDELIAFHVNNSKGTQDAINKVKNLGKPVQEFKYEID